MIEANFIPRVGIDILTIMKPQVGMGRIPNPAGLVLTFSPRLYQVCFMYVTWQHHILIDVGRNEKRHFSVSLETWHVDSCYSVTWPIYNYS